MCPHGSVLGVVVERGVPPTEGADAPLWNAVCHQRRCRCAVVERVFHNGRSRAPVGGTGCCTTVWSGPWLGAHRVPERPSAPGPTHRVTGAGQGVLDLADRRPCRSGRRSRPARRRRRPRPPAGSAPRRRRRRRRSPGPSPPRGPPDQLEVEAVLGAVGVHRVEQDLAGAELGRRGPPTRPRRARPRRPPCVVTSKPGVGARPHRRASTDSTSTCGRTGRRSRPTSSGRAIAAVLTATLSAPARSSRSTSSTVRDSPADGQRDEHLLGGAATRSPWSSPGPRGTR